MKVLVCYALWMQFNKNECENATDKLNGNFSLAQKSHTFVSITLCVCKPAINLVAV